MKIIFVSTAVSLFIALLIRNAVSNKKEPFHNKTEWVQTIGILDPHGYGRGKIRYRVGNMAYVTIFKFRNDQAVEGEKYRMKYNEHNPEEVLIDFWDPIFEDTEKTHFFSARINKIHPKSFWDPTPFIVYSYNIANHPFKKWVYLPPDYEHRYPKLKEGECYLVECWDLNINRVVLHLDKPCPRL